MKKIKVLNLYAGIGGNRKHWENVEVTAVEYDENIAKEYQQKFPNDKVVVADAHAYLLEHYSEFDFIWSSPPCISHSKINLSYKNNPVQKLRYIDTTLYQEIIFLQTFFDGGFVVENVKPYYEPLIKPKINLGRHYFWSNFNIVHIDSKVGVFGSVNGKSTKNWSGKKRKEERNMCCPKIAKHIFSCYQNKVKGLSDFLG